MFGYCPIHKFAPILFFSSIYTADNKTHISKSTLSIYSSFFWGLECSNDCKCGMTNGLERDRRGKTTNYVSGGWVSKNKIIKQQKNSLNDLFVYQASTHELGMVQPNEETSLDNVVEWNPTCNKACDRFSDRKACENNPISQPLRVIGSITRVDSLK